MRKYIIGMTLGLAAGVGAASAIVLGHRRVQEWETLNADDAPCGGFVDCTAARVRFIQRGDHGDPIVLIHGLMDSAEFWHNNLDALAQHYRVWAIDLVGFGYSSRVAAPVYSLKYFARSVREFMDAQGIDRAHIVGHSLGGAVALQFAHDYPARVAKQILIAPGTFLVNYVRWLKPVARLPHLPRAMMGLTMTSEQARLRAWYGALGDPAHIDASDLEMRVRPMRIKGTADALVAMAASEWACDLPAELHRIAAPTLIVWGTRDRVVPVAHAQKHVDALPNARLKMLNRAGHIPQIEFPDVVNRWMLDFLNQVDT